MAENPDYKPNTPTNMWVHEPLPYTVRLRATLSEDSRPLVQEHKVMSYSVLEAMMQAIIEAGGSGVEDTRYKVEHVSPDVPHYVALTFAKVMNDILKKQQ